MVKEREGIRKKAFSPKWLIDGGSFGRDGEHQRKSRIGPRAEDEFILGLEMEVSAKKPNGK